MSLRITTVFLALLALSLQAQTLPSAFIENHGQWSHETLFMARRPEMTLSCERDGLVMSLCPRPDGAAGPTIALRLEEAKEGVKLIGERARREHYSFITGSDPSQWRAGLPGYDAVRYEGIRDGVDLRVREHLGRLEYDLLLAPGADLGGVVIFADGVQNLSIASDGGLVMHTASGPVRQSPPVTWEVLESGERRSVPTRFRIIDARRYGFSAPDRDCSRPLVVDPGILWGAFVGGNGQDFGHAVAYDDATGDVFLAGGTQSSNLPQATNTFVGATGSRDVYVARVDPSLAGCGIVWCTYIAGNAEDEAYDIVLDGQGFVTVTGRTASSNFPTTPNAMQSFFQGGVNDAFLVTLDAGTGTVMPYASFIGGNGAEWGAELRVDSTGSVYTVGGFTSSTAGFPTTPNARPIGGAQDAFVVQIDVSQAPTSQLVYGTQFGGSAQEGHTNNNQWRPHLLGLHVADSGVITLSAITWSANLLLANPPLTPPYQAISAGAPVGFIVQLLPGSTSTQVLWATFLGPTTSVNFAWAGEVHVDQQGIVTVAGETNWPQFPVTTTPATPFVGASDSFVSQFDPSQSGQAQLIYSALIGGDGFDAIMTMRPTSDGSFVLTGVSQSNQNNIPMPTTSGAAMQTVPTPAPENVAWVARLNPQGNWPQDLEYATYLAGTDNQTSLDLDLDPDCGAVVSGNTRSGDFFTTICALPATAPGVCPPCTFVGGAPNEAWVARLDLLPVGTQRVGTPTGAGRLVIDVNSQPKVGNLSFAVTCKGAPPNSAGIMGFSTGVLPTPATSCGVDVWIDPAAFGFIILPVISDGRGGATVPLPIPPNPALIGFTGAAQFAWGFQPCTATVSASAALVAIIQC